MPFEEDDPVIASYDVFISPSTIGDATTTNKKQPELYILQYPSHRPSTKPYNTSRSQKPTSLRLKANTGIIELDVPILTSDNYNLPLGSQFGKAIHESRVAHPLTTHGLSGGFSNNQSSINNPVTTSDIPQHGIDTTLYTQTLGGKMSTNTDKDPIYMLATLKPNSRELHLQHLDGVVQLRPQLHHIDAAEEIKKRIETATSRAKSSNTAANVDPSAPIKLETKAIELKLKDQSKGDDLKDRNQNLNARLLRDIQNDPWQPYDWVETRHSKDFNLTSLTGMTTGVGPNSSHSQLKATLDNDEWLNKMSSPGIELRTRLKGRDRERARRKRQERARAARGEAAVAALTQEIVSASGSDTDLSDDEDGQVQGQEDGIDFGSSAAAARNDVDNDAGTTTYAPGPSESTNNINEEPSSPVIQIKQEAPAPAPVPAPVPEPEPLSTMPVMAAAAPKRRGRPPRSKAG